MPKRTGIETKGYLIDAALPNHENTYTVIPHEFVINKTLEQLAANGFVVERELYRCNMNALVASGVYHLKYGDDPDIGMMFAWSNSYDKSMRFKCAIGAYVKISGSNIIAADMAMWGRKHTGSADSEASENIQQQIANADAQFSAIVRCKKAMKAIIVDKQKSAELAGRLFIEYNLLNSEQMGVIKGQIKNPEFDYNAPIDSLWVFYNHITLALQRSHPQKWMEHQRLVHLFMDQEFKLDDTASYPEPEKVVTSTEYGVMKDNTFKKDPNQIDLEDSIREVEESQGLEEEQPKEEVKVEETKPIVETKVEEPFMITPDNGIPKAPPIDL